MLATLSLAVLFAPAVITGGNVDTAYQKLQEAVQAKDVAQVQTLAAETCALAREVIASPAPTDKDEQEGWNERVKYAKSIELYTEYALSAGAVGARPEDTVALLNALAAQNPKSKYLPDSYALYFYALHQTGAASKIPAVAEKAVENFPEQDDALAILAESAFGAKQSDRALGYANRLRAAVAKRARPENVPAGEWERKRSSEMATGYFIAGVVEAEKSSYFDADKNLRAALPLVAGNQTRSATALFYLGLANYQLGKMTMKKAQVLEAAKFSEQAAAIQGPLAQQAWHNAQVMKTEAARMR